MPSAYSKHSGTSCPAHQKRAQPMSFLSSCRCDLFLVGTRVSVCPFFYPSVCHFNEYILKTYCVLGPLPGTRMQSRGDYMTSLSFRS